MRRLSVFFIVFFTAVASLPAGLRAPQTTEAQLAAPEKWAADLDLLAKELPARHKNLFFKISREDFQASVADLKARIPKLNRTEFLLGLSRLLASVGDSHTSFTIMPRRAFPLKLYWFKDGIYVVDTTPEFAGLLNGRIESVDGHPIEDVVRAFAGIFPHDNEAQVKDFVPRFLGSSEHLLGLGLLAEPDKATFTVRTPKGAVVSAQMDSLALADVRKVAWAAPAVDPASLPPYRRLAGSAYEYVYLPADKTLYFAYNSCRDMPNKPFAAFSAGLWETIRKNPVDKLVVDLRANGGGDSSILDPFINELAADKNLNQKGRIFVILGRRTFSSAILNALDLRKKTAAVFYGEPTGGRPNHYGEIRMLTLPNLGIQVSYSTKYFRFVEGDEPSILPDVPVDLTLADFLALRDPVLEAILARPAPGRPVASSDHEGCTVIGVGPGATVDGSVITSHTDCCSECRIQVIPGRTFPPGAMAPVHWGMAYFGAGDDRRPLPLGDFGKVIGHIPQAERTYTYFHTGYSQMNEKQLAIGESTCSQRAELDVPYVEGLTRQIMTVEQAQVFALQRCASAREAVKLIGGLVEKYGFLPSCSGSEALCIADPRELWEMEICSVGPEWTPESGKPGAIWAARRIPDDHVIVIANYFRIREIDPGDQGTLVSPNYMTEAVSRGWYDPESGRPFIWQEAYAPPIREGNLSRMWLVTSSLAPSLKAWPKRSMSDFAGPATLYSQDIEGAAFYPYSFKPERKVSVRDIIAFQRSAFEDTIYDMTLDPAWAVAGGGGRMVKSPMASPFIGPDLERALGIRHHRTIATEGYGMVAQLRSWLPDAIGGIYWFYVDNPFVSPYIPIYAGVTDVSPFYKTYDYFAFSEDSARWAVDFVEKLMLLRWQAAVKDLRQARDPVEAAFFAEQGKVDAEAAALLEKDPAEAAKFLTALTIGRMEKLVDLYRNLRRKLLTKYTGDGV